MIDRERFAENFKKMPIIAIFRGVTPDKVQASAEAVVEGGIRFIELTLNSPDALLSIRTLADRYAGTDIIIGAGRVLKPQEVVAVAEAGGRYIISPNTDVDVIKTTRHLDLISIAGFFTPTEAFLAADAGADYLKCFPAGALGVGYIKDLKAVMNKPLIAVGGVKLENVQLYLAVVAGVGIGSNLYSLKKTVIELKHAAEEYCRCVRKTLTGLA